MHPIKLSFANYVSSSDLFSYQYGDMKVIYSTLRGRLSCQLARDSTSVSTLAWQILDERVTYTWIASPQKTGFLAIGKRRQQFAPSSVDTLSRVTGNRVGGGVHTTTTGGIDLALARPDLMCIATLMVEYVS